MSFEKRKTSEEPEIEFTANVRTGELRFEVVPDPEVEFPGRPGSTSDWISERERLPNRVQPGVVYHDPVVRLLIASETTAGGLERERTRKTRHQPGHRTAGRKPEIEEEQK